jgi:hypothetical protein
VTSIPIEGSIWLKVIIQGLSNVSWCIPPTSW